MFNFSYLEPDIISTFLTMDIDSEIKRLKDLTASKIAAFEKLDVKKKKSSKGELLLKEIRKLKIDPYITAEKYFIQNIEETKQHAQKAQQLLATSDANATVYKNDYSFFGTHAQKLSGKLNNDNGRIYCQKEKTGFYLINIMFPSAYAGTINYKGEVELSVADNNFSIFWSKVPRAFEGYINEDGHIRLNMITSSWDPDGHLTIQDMLINPFFNAHDRKMEYFNTREKIRTYVKYYVDKI